MGSDILKILDKTTNDEKIADNKTLTAFSVRVNIPFNLIENFVLEKPRSKKLSDFQLVFIVFISLPRYTETDKNILAFLTYQDSDKNIKIEELSHCPPQVKKLEVVTLMEDTKSGFEQIGG